MTPKDRLANWGRNGISLVSCHLETDSPSVAHPLKPPSDDSKSPYSQRLRLLTTNAMPRPHEMSDSAGKNATPLLV